jgi:hypothetical protein
MWGYILAGLFIACIVMTMRAFLVVIGAYKDPILSSFEHYGEERIFSPLYSLLGWMALSVYLSLYFLVAPGLAFGIGVVFVLPIISLRDYITEGLQRYRWTMWMFPRWYADLAQRTDREERRRIAYLWLRLPLRTRLLYNTQTVFFRHWVDQVLLTIA